jgi:hypothetical protein
MRIKLIIAFIITGLTILALLTSLYSLSAPAHKGG